MGNDPSISVVIPSYNRKESVLALLSDLYRQAGTTFEVIVVDDRSQDGSVVSIAQQFPLVTLIQCEKNGGPCVARNRGIRASRGEFIVGFDTDVTIPDRHLLEKVRTAFQVNPDAAGFAFRILKPDGVTDDAPRWWHPVPLKHFADKMFESSYFCGTAYAFRRTPLLDSELYPEWLYMHYEEVVLSYRLLDRGFKLVYHPNLIVIHHARPSSGDSVIDKYYTPRNQLLVAAACLPFWSAVVYMIPRLGFQFLKSLWRNSFLSWTTAITDGFQKIASGDFIRSPIKMETVRHMKMLSRQYQR